MQARASGSPEEVHPALRIWSTYHFGIPRSLNHLARVEFPVHHRSARRSLEHVIHRVQPRCVTGPSRLSLEHLMTNLKRIEFLFFSCSTTNWKKEWQKLTINPDGRRQLATPARYHVLSDETLCCSVLLRVLELWFPVPSPLPPWALVAMSNLFSTTLMNEACHKNIRSDEQNFTKGYDGGY